MLKSYMDSIKLGIIETLFDRIGAQGMTIDQIQAALPRNTKYPERNLAELMEAKIVVCDNPEAPEKERMYSGNTKSKIFTSLFNIDIELSDLEYIRKKKIRKQMLAGAKK